MAGEIIWDVGSAITLETTNLNSFAANETLLTSAITGSGQYTLAKVGLYLAVQGSARDAGGYCSLYVLPEFEATNDEYPAGGSGTPGVIPMSTYKRENLLYTTAVTAEWAFTNPFAADFADMKVWVQNKTGVAFNASGNILKIIFGTPKVSA